MPTETKKHGKTPTGYGKSKNKSTRLPEVFWDGLATVAERNGSSPNGELMKAVRAHLKRAKVID